MQCFLESLQSVDFSSACLRYPRISMVKLEVKGVKIVFKGLNRLGLSDINSKFFPDEGGMIGFLVSSSSVDKKQNAIFQLIMVIKNKILQLKEIRGKQS